MEEGNLIPKHILNAVDQQVALNAISDAQVSEGEPAARRTGMQITSDSHVDHDLSPDHLDWLLQRFQDRDGFFIETVELPAHLSPVACGLHGPEMGDAPVPDAEVRMVVRGNRKGPSRLCSRPPRMTRQLTVIAGPHDGLPCVMYTAFGGPVAPKEPWDPSLDDAGRAASEAFWAQHCLSM